MMGSTQLVSQGNHRFLVEVTQLTASEDGLSSSLRSLALLHTMDKISEVVGQAVLSSTTPRLLLGLASQLLDLLTGARAEDLEVLDDPDRSGLSLAVLGAISLGQQRGHQTVDGVAGRPADELCTSRDVAPLVLSTRLQGATVTLVKLVEVQ